MRKLAIVIIAILVVYGMLGGLVVLITPNVFPGIRRLDVVRILIEFLVALSTLSAVLWALFGESLIKRLHKSNLQLVADKDESLCCLVTDEAQVQDVERTCLEICVKITNESPTEATGCQLVTNEIYVSSDGIKFSKLRSVCTAAFKWVYEDDYETTVQKDIDKFARLVEIIREVSKPVGVPDGSVGDERVERTSLVVQIPDHPSKKEVIDLGVDYKGVMFPVKLVSRTENVKLYYLQVVWQGKDLKEFKVADKLKVRRLTEAEAKRDIV